MEADGVLRKGLLRARSPDTSFSRFAVIGGARHALRHAMNAAPCLVPGTRLEALAGLKAPWHGLRWVLAWPTFW